MKKTLLTLCFAGLMLAQSPRKCCPMWNTAPRVKKIKVPKVMPPVPAESTEHTYVPIVPVTPYYYGYGYAYPVPVYIVPYFPVAPVVGPGVIR